MRGEEGSAQAESEVATTDTAETASEQAERKPDPDAEAPDEYSIPTSEDIAAGDFADPFGSTEQEGARDRYDAGARVKDLTGQEGGQQGGYDEQGAGTGDSYSSSGAGGQRSTEEILKGVQDKTRVPGDERTEEEWMQSPLDQETEPDYTFGAGGLLDEAAGRSLPTGTDDLAAAADETGAPGPPTGKEGISDQPTGGVGYPAGTYNEQEGLQGTKYKPGDSSLEEFGKGLSGHFVPGQGLGPTNEMHRELLKGDTSVKEIKNPDGTTTKVYESEDGTKAVVKGDTITTVSPGGTVTETKIDPKTGEETTTTYNPKTGEETTTTKKAESSETGGGVGDPGPEGGATREEMAKAMEQKALYDWMMQNATGRGPGGGEEVNSTREGGGEYGTGAFAGAQDRAHSLVGQPPPEEGQYGGGGDKSGSTDHDRGAPSTPAPTPSRAGRWATPRMRPTPSTRTSTTRGRQPG